jgi:hypothetical protein
MDVETDTQPGRYHPTYAIAVSTSQPGDGPYTRIFLAHGFVLASYFSSFPFLPLSPVVPGREGLTLRGSLDLIGVMDMIGTTGAMFSAPPPAAEVSSGVPVPAEDTAAGPSIPTIERDGPSPWMLPGNSSCITYRVPVIHLYISDRDWFMRLKECMYLRRWDLMLAHPIMQSEHCQDYILGLWSMGTSLGICDDLFWDMLDEGWASLPPEMQIGPALAIVN